MHKRTPHHNKRDQRPHNLLSLLLRRVRQMVRRGVFERQRGARLQHGAGLDGEEDPAQAHGAEVPAEERFGEGADVGDPGVEHGDDGDAAEEEDEGEERQEAQGRDVRGDALGFEGVPWDDAAEVDEHGAVEEEVDDER